MKISELIEKLQAIQEEEGDLEIMIPVAGGNANDYYTMDTITVDGNEYGDADEKCVYLD